MLYYLSFLLLSLTVLGLGMKDFLPEELSIERQDLAVIPLVGALGAYIFLVFGFLSRRCERQADIYGCRAVSCGQTDCLGHTAETELVPRGRGLCPTGIRTFIDALEKVAFLNGISRDRPGWLQSWQHSTIARRRPPSFKPGTFVIPRNVIRSMGCAGTSSNRRPTPPASRLACTTTSEKRPRLNR